jgi:hypothetical protein
MMKSRHLTIILALLLGLLAPRVGETAATLLPPGENCFQATTGLNGMVGALGTLTGGSGGVTGPTIYGGVTLTGGSGQNATANITVTAGAVTSVVVLNPGIQYVVGDSLSAASGDIGGVSGFTVIVNSTSINSSLAGGSVYFYIPNTSTFKQTWANAGQTILNTNPVTLNQNGCAIIYGVGTYRQVLQDSLGNTVWDQLTTDTSANNNYFWAGTAGGTANTITVTDTGFNGTDGSIIAWIPLATNTGPATVNPSGFGAVPIVKDTSTGAVALSGGEMVANSPSNVVEAIYSASQGNFHILNLVAASGGATVFPPLCSSQGLKIVNSSSTPGTFTITVNQVVVINTTNGTFATLPQPLTAVPLTLTLNMLGTPGANALDTGTIQPSTPYYAYIIYNGITAATLGSASATAPTKPSGYAYTCRVGSMLTDSTPIFYQTQQNGSVVTYRITAATNTALPPNIVNGAAGTLTTLVSPVLASESLVGFIPPTATQVMLLATNNYKSQASTPAVMVAPSLSWGGTQNGPTGSNGLVWPFYAEAGGSPQSALLTFNLEALSFGYVSNGASGAVSIYGWKDSVNAN